MILCGDGGGIKGRYSIRLVERLANLCYPEQPSPGLYFMARMRWIVGTSIWGINALALRRSMSPRQVGQIYNRWASQIFTKRWFGGMWPWSSKYRQTPKQHALRAVFGDMTLDGNFVVVTAYDPEQEEMLWLDSGLAWQAAMATSAAPTYFPAFQLGKRWLVDGGMGENNPSLETRARFPGEAILSVGCGIDSSQGLKPRNWGPAQWAMPAVSQMMAAEESQYVSPPYFRLNGPLPWSVALDDISALPALIQAADAVDLAPARDFVLAELAREEAQLRLITSTNEEAQK